MATKKKVAAKPAAKKATSSKKPASSSKPKPAARPVAKKPVAKAHPAKKTASSIAKSAPKKVSKPMAKPAAKKPATPAKAVKQPAKAMKPVAKAIALKKAPAKPVYKAVAKPAPKVVSRVVPSVKPVQSKAGKKVAVAKVIAPKKSTVGLKPLPKKEVPKPAYTPPKQIITPPPFKKTPPKEVPPVRTGKLVIPEIKTKTVRKYEPDFTKSVLDTLMQDPSAPTQRYSDADLAEFRDLINKKLEAARTELNYLQGLITRKDEMGGDETDNRYMTMEDGSMSMEREQLSQMASRQITYIDHLEKALMRIENKTYGICRVTGKLIDKARLRAVPHATLSIEAKQMQK